MRAERKSNLRWVVALGALLIGGFACNTHELNPFEAGVRAGAVDSTQQGEVRPVDILFVVDNSNSMCEEQAILRDNFNRFINILADAEADFRLAVINTDMVDLEGGFGAFRTSPGTYNNIGACSIQIPDTSGCPASVGPVLASADYMGPDGLDTASLQSDFSCLALTGIDGSPVEMGLETMRQALSKQQANQFLRPNALLSIVFVTDENDCSDGTQGGQRGPVYEAVIGGAGDSACEYSRNVEDSHQFAMGDQFVTDDEGDRVLERNLGPDIEHDGVTLPAREWAIQGDRAAVEAIGAGQLNIKCEDGGIGCSNGLIQRREYYDFLVRLVAQKNGYDDDLAAAANDIIVATILNPDAGVRYNSNEPVPSWCGDAGSQGYRYQQVAEMFSADRRVIAPICNLDTGQPADFADDLEAIAEVIGKAINSVCLQNPPMTCQADSDCPEGQTCGQNVYFSESEDLAYRLCSGFSVRVEVESGTDAEGNTTTTRLEQGVDYDLNFEAGSCINPDGSGSPIEVNFLQPPPSNANILFSYPRRVGEVF